jgi:two-component system OmpR family response regulator
MGHHPVTFEERLAKVAEVGGSDGVSACGGKRLLLVEDEFRTADFLVRGLAPLGIEVTVAEDGEVARFLAATERFDAVVVDLGSSAVSGHDALPILPGEQPAVPVIVLSATDGPESRRAVARVGVSACLTKPIVFEDLRERILACLGGALEAREAPQGGQTGSRVSRMTP